MDWPMERRSGYMSSVNLSTHQHQLSGLGAAALVAAGLMSRGWLRTFLFGLGAGLAYQGVTGHSVINEAMNLNPGVKTNKNAVSVPHQQGMHISKSVTIDRPVEELYDFWRNFENLPQIMRHLKSVEVLGPDRSHWVAKAPAGLQVEWDAEIINDIRNEVIAWRSLEDAQIANAGSVRFNEAPGGRGTEVRVELEYVPPAGKLGAAAAKLMGEEPSVQIDEDLRRFKQMMEAGEVATTKGQTSGRRKASK